MDKAADISKDMVFKRALRVIWMRRTADKIEVEKTVQSLNLYCGQFSPLEFFTKQALKVKSSQSIWQLNTQNFLSYFT